AVEVVPADGLDDVGDRVLGQHHAAEHAALGWEVLRRGALQAAVRSGFEGFRGCHPASVGVLDRTYALPGVRWAMLRWPWRLGRIRRRAVAVTGAAASPARRRPGRCAGRR